MRIKILVVDDEESICEILKYNLSLEGYNVDTACCAEEALEFDLPSYSLIILDIMMDSISGFDFAKRLKNTIVTEKIPILFCSALNGEDEKVLGLNLGADDFITKPFQIREFMARVRSVIRRSSLNKYIEKEIASGTYLPDIVFKDLRIDQNKREAFIDANPIPLTKMEYALLLYLVSKKNTIHSRDEIMQQVWHKDISTFRTIDTTVTRLRKKLGDYGSHIITRLGYGYGFQEEI